MHPVLFEVGGHEILTIPMINLSCAMKHDQLHCLLKKFVEDISNSTAMTARTR